MAPDFHKANLAHEKSIIYFINVAILSRIVWCMKKCFFYFNGTTLSQQTRIPGLWATLDSKRWALNAGLWMLDSGPWTLDSGLWTLDSGRWTLDAWLGLMDTFVNWGTQFLILLDVTGILWRVCSNMTCYIVKEYRLKKLQCEKLD